MKLQDVQEIAINIQNFSWNCWLSHQVKLTQILCYVACRPAVATHIADDVAEIFRPFCRCSNIKMNRYECFCQKINLLTEGCVDLLQLR